MASPDVDAEFLRKLGWKPGQKLSLVGAPKEWVTAFRGVADGAVVAARSIEASRVADMHLVWLEPVEDLRDVFDTLERRIPPDGSIWAVIPKKAALRKGDRAVEWASMQAAGLASGKLVDNKELRFDDRYYGTRFVVRKDQR